MMKAPQITGNTEKTIQIIPTGGLNLSLPKDQLPSEQSPDMCNMWVRDGLLTLRPGVKKLVEQQYGKILDVSRELLIKRVTTRVNGEITNITENRGVYIVTPTTVLSYDGTTVNVIGTGTFERFCLISANKSSVYDSGMVPGDSIVQKIHYEADAVYLIGDGLLYSIRLYRTGLPPFYTYTLKLVPIKYLSAADPITTDPRENPYVPTIAINCKAAKDGDASESRNFLSPMVKQTFTTDNQSTVYHLHDTWIDNTGSTGTAVTVTCDMLNGTTNTWKFNQINTSVIAGGITATLDASAGTITFSAPLVDADSANKSNNMTVTYGKTLYESNNPIRNCNLATWFGGVYQGQESGNCLFCSGNADKPNAVYWSSPTEDGSLYFPEKSVNYLGTPTDQITALMKLFNILIVFKANSIHRISYEYDSTNSAYIFPAQEVHTGIGCDIPESVQIINNALVWANSKSGIYTLLSTTVKDERVVRPISKNINNALIKRPIETLKSATSVDSEGYYILFAGDIAFAWNYINTPFTNYADNDKAQTLLSWFEWKLPRSLSFAGIIGGKICAAGDDGTIYALDETETTDDSARFDAWWTSAQLDFSLPQTLKRITRLHIDFTDIPMLLTLLDAEGNADYLTGDRDKNVTFTTSSKWTRYCTLKFQRNNDAAGAGIQDIICSAVHGRRL